MSQNDSGIGGYPAYVKAAFMIMLDPPSKVEVRVDPESKQKAEEERQRNEQAEERLRQSSFPPGLNRRSPPLVTLYLQWLDATYPEQPVWRDVRMNIDVEKRRFRNNAAGIPFLSRGRQGSGALGVVLVSIPFLLLASPYIVWRSRRDSAREAQAGMSRHASALLEKLRGQLDDETEALLVDAMKDLYRRDVKLVRRVTLEEAKRVLAEAHLTIVRFPGTGTSPGFAAYEWVDDEGDIVGKAEVFPKRAGEPDVQVLSSWFRGPEAAGLLACYREKILRDWGKRGEDAPTDAA